jgi:hypothetical protein
MMYREFGPELRPFHLVSEATSTPNRYRLKTFPSFTKVLNILLSHDNIVTMSDHKQFGPPNPAFLAIHPAIGNILHLHLTDRGETIEKLMRDLGSIILPYWPTMRPLTSALFCRLASFRFLPLVETQQMTRILSSSLEPQPPRRLCPAMRIRTRDRLLLTILMSDDYDENCTVPQLMKTWYQITHIAYSTKD